MNPWQTDDLMTWFEAVNRARSELRRARGRGSPRDAIAVQQQELLSALEGCAGALARCGHPVPHHIHHELALYRALFASPTRVP